MIKRYEHSVFLEMGFGHARKVQRPVKLNHHAALRLRPRVVLTIGRIQELNGVHPLLLLGNSVLHSLESTDSREA